ncbi:MAG: TcpQ domain-containing protein [Alphaproteobacteria bacterium]|nr:TcpQ domain-containing protein [Alphaproteobacteria bacterium]
MPDKTSLAETAARLGPAGVTLRWDRRVDAGHPVEQAHGDWRSLLFDQGLAWRRFGDELHVRPAGIPEGGIEFASARAGASDWRIWAEETLRSVMSRWGARAGVEVVWRTDRHYRLHDGRVFRGRTFEEAAALLFAALGAVPDAPVGRLAEDGSSMAMKHVKQAGVTR